MAEKDSHSVWNRAPLLSCHTVKLNQDAMKVREARLGWRDLEQRQLDSLVQISHPI